MKIITDVAVYSELLALVRRAREFVILVSPYLDPPSSVIAELDRAAVTKRVQVYLVARGGEDRAKQEVAASSIQDKLTFLGFVERLHAKVYLNESEALLTSMNLSESSAVNSIEVGTHFEKAQYPKPYDQVLDFCKSIIDRAMQDEHRRPAGKPSPRPVVENPLSPRTQPRRQGDAKCIRCSDVIPFNLEKPLCACCYRSWSQYENETYEEHFCHACGREKKTCKARPLCRSCYAA